MIISHHLYMPHHYLDAWLAEKQQEQWKYVLRSTTAPHICLHLGTEWVITGNSTRGEPPSFPVLQVGSAYLRSSRSMVSKFDIVSGERSERTGRHLCWCVLTAWPRSWGTSLRGFSTFCFSTSHLRETGFLPLGRGMPFYTAGTLIKKFGRAVWMADRQISQHNFFQWALHCKIKNFIQHIESFGILFLELYSMYFVLCIKIIVWCKGTRYKHPYNLKVIKKQ